MAGQFEFEGLITDDKLKFLVDLVQWGVMVSGPMSNIDCVAAEKLIRSIIRRGKTLVDDAWARHANTHSRISFSLYFSYLFSFCITTSLHVPCVC